jgi:hypothetical protein
MNQCKDCVYWCPNTEHFRQLKKMCICPDREPEETDDLFGCASFLGSNSSEVNVPNHTRKGTMRDPNPNPVDGPTHILIATYGTPKLRVSGNVVSDLDWLRHCLRSIRKHCSGFSGVTVAFPGHEVEMFNPLVQEYGVILKPHAEYDGMGFLSHQIQMAHAESIVPQGTKYVLHCDADCIFRMPTTPEHYFWQDKPYHIIRSWESLTTEDPRNPGSKVVSDCLQWKDPTDRQLGLNTKVYTMCMNTGVFPVDFYPRYRKHISAVQRMPFDKFMYQGRNDHPCDRMDWTAMGAWAHRYMHGRFHWFDVEKPPYPEDRKLAFWSHQGIDAATLATINELIG